MRGLYTRNQELYQVEEIIASELKPGEKIFVYDGFHQHPELCRVGVDKENDKYWIEYYSEETWRTEIIKLLPEQTVLIAVTDLKQILPAVLV